MVVEMETQIMSLPPWWNLLPGKLWIAAFATSLHLGNILQFNWHKSRTKKRKNSIPRMKMKYITPELACNSDAGDKKGLFLQDNSFFGPSLANFCSQILQLMSWKLYGEKLLALGKLFTWLSIHWLPSSSLSLLFFWVVKWALIKPRSDLGFYTILE